tara:strand:- start:568 stop:1797 length:1230 start_codon:yes stop_codon:yes gene_type:complete
MKRLALPQGGLADFQDAVTALKNLGRFEDDTIAHVATGETIIPMEVFEKNPELRDEVFASMAKLGINPAEYIVGSNLNSINPVTGQPEFFLKKLVKKLKKAAPVLLPLAASFIPGASPLIVGAAGTAGGLIGGQDPRQALLSGITAGGLAGLAKGSQAAMLGRQAGGRSLGSSLFKGIQEGGLGTLFQGAQPAYTGVDGLAGGQGVAPAAAPSATETATKAATDQGFFEKATNIFREDGDPGKGFSTKRILAGLFGLQGIAQIFPNLFSGQEEEGIAYAPELYPGEGIFDSITNVGFAPAYSAGTNIVPSMFAAQGGIVGMQEPVNGLKRVEGIRAMAEGGFPEDAPRARGMLRGPGTGTSDDIPAYLSNGEFVVTAKAVKNAGGAKPMYEMMANLEKGGKLSPASRGK